MSPLPVAQVTHKADHRMAHPNECERAMHPQPGCPPPRGQPQTLEPMYWMAHAEVTQVRRVIARCLRSDSATLGSVG